MMICPKDGKGCCDDLCRGSGCMLMDGYPMLEVCHVCKGTIDHEIEDCSTCTCGDEEYPEVDEPKEKYSDRNDLSALLADISASNRGIPT